MSWVWWGEQKYAGKHHKSHKRRKTRVLEMCVCPLGITNKLGLHGQLSKCIIIIKANKLMRLLMKCTYCSVMAVDLPLCVVSETRAGPPRPPAQDWPSAGVRRRPHHGGSLCDPWHQREAAGGEGGLERTPQVCRRQAQEDGRLHRQTGGELSTTGQWGWVV